MQSCTACKLTNGEWRITSTICGSYIPGTQFNLASGSSTSTSQVFVGSVTGFNANYRYVSFGTTANPIVFTLSSSCNLIDSAGNGFYSSYTPSTGYLVTGPSGSLDQVGQCTISSSMTINCQNLAYSQQNKFSSQGTNILISTSTTNQVTLYLPPVF